MLIERQASNSFDVRSAPSPPRISLALEIGLVVLGLLLLLGAVLLALYLRHKRSSHDTAPRRFSKVAPSSAPSESSSSPYGHAPPHTPRYKHVPGTHMRTAHRDWDGSWKLLDPDTPFQPSGVLELTPSPSSSTFRVPPPFQSQSVESFSVTRGYDGYDYDDSPRHRTPDFGNEVLDITHGKG